MSIQEDGMVFDSELGIGAFVSISDKDREIVRRARAASIETPPPVPSRLAVEVVMAAWRAGHLV